MKSDNQRPMLYRYFEDSAELLLSAYKRSKGQSASSNLGRNREVFCSQFLSQVLPPRMKIVSGELCDSNEKVSGQLELILTRDDMPALFYGGEDTYFVESVLAVIEVKSNLTSHELTKTIERLRKVRALDSKPAFAYADDSLKRPLCCLFAYEGYKLEVLHSILEQPEYSGVIDIVSVLKRGIILAQGLKLTLPTDGNYGICSGKAASLAWLYYHLAYYAASFSVRQIPIDYFEPINHWSDQDPLRD